MNVLNCFSHYSQILQSAHLKIIPHAKVSCILVLTKLDAMCYTGSAVFTIRRRFAETCL